MRFSDAGIGDGSGRDRAGGVRLRFDAAVVLLLVERIRQPSETLGPVLGYVMRDDLVRPDPDPDAVVTWFVSQISTYPPSGPIKSAFFNLATRRFSRRLTREVFNRIWTLHAPPPWKQPGQRKKRHLR